jgi:hypothetical protein
VLSTAKIGDNHLWYDKHLQSGGVPHISNTLAERLRASGMTGIGLRHVEEA